MEISEHVLAQWYALLSASMQAGGGANVNDVTTLYMEGDQGHYSLLVTLLNILAFSLSTCKLLHVVVF